LKNDPKIYWFTGQPGHGKTVLADRLNNHLQEFTGRKVFRIDGDHLRKIMTNKDYSTEGRLKNVKLAQQIAMYLLNQGHDVVVSVVSPFEDQRQEFKDLIGDSIYEFYVFTSEIRGREQYHVPDYMPPRVNFIPVDTTNVSIDTSLEQILTAINLNKI
jgi:adenylylsulfate kinase-like enzyme